MPAYERRAYRTAAATPAAATALPLLKNVNPKIVSKMLGHSTIAITIDTYSHLLPARAGSPCQSPRRCPLYIWSQLSTECCTAPPCPPFGPPSSDNVWTSVRSCAASTFCCAASFGASLVSSFGALLVSETAHPEVATKITINRISWQRYTEGF